jgi:glycosyltransferase involved in cell wall biosynthesis
VLEQAPYYIDPHKLKHIDHGVRMHHRSDYDRLHIKEEYGLTGRVLITTLGMLSPDKGVHYGIRAYGRFLKESCTDRQRQQIVYVIAGQCHPEFMATEAGQPYRAYQQELHQALQQSGLQWCKVDRLQGVDFSAVDVIFLDTFLDEVTLLKLYGATNIMLLPYLNTQQISSGILADTLGSGRVAITTKFRYALELIHSNKRYPEGLVIGRHARGILVDPGEPSVEQMAQALDYLVFNREKRLAMERQAHQRGYQMRWHNTAWALLQHIDFVRDQQHIVSGRGIVLKRDKPSIYQRRHGPQPAGNSAQEYMK